VVRRTGHNDFRILDASDDSRRNKQKMRRGLHVFQKQGPIRALGLVDRNTRRNEGGRVGLSHALLHHLEKLISRHRPVLRRFAKFVNCRTSTEENEQSYPRKDAHAKILISRPHAVKPHQRPGMSLALSWRYASYFAPNSRARICSSRISLIT